MRFRRTPVVLGAALLAALTCAGTAQATDPPRYVPYYAIFTRGAAVIPNVTNSDNTGGNAYVPQGLAYWPETDELVVSYYDDGGGRTQLAILDRKTSKLKKTLYLDAKIHANSLAMSKNYLWVSATGSPNQVFRYAKSAISSTADKGQVAKNKAFTLKESSDIEISGNYLYAGAFNETAKTNVYRYPLSAAEEPAAAADKQYGIPSQVQGITLANGKLIMARSYGRNNDSSLVAGPLGGAATKTLVAPNMAEDLAVVGSEVYVIYESGAKKYKDADYKVRTIHHGPAAKLTG